MPITERDAETVEQAVYEMHNATPALALCIRYRWIHEFSGRRLATKMNTNRITIWQQVAQAETTIQGMLVFK